MLISIKSLWDPLIMDKHFQSMEDQFYYKAMTTLFNYQYKEKNLFQDPETFLFMRLQRAPLIDLLFVLLSKALNNIFYIMSQIIQGILGISRNIELSLGSK